MLWVRLKTPTSEGGMTKRLQRALPRLILQHVLVVRSIHLLEEDERQNRVRSQTSIVRGEPFPQTEEALLTNHLCQHILQTNDN